MTADHGAWAFDYRTATRGEILARAELIQGRTLGALAGSGNAQTVKERTFRTMVDYDALARETWLTATIRHKLDHLLPNASRSAASIE